MEVFLKRNSLGEWRYEIHQDSMSRCSATTTTRPVAISVWYSTKEEALQSAKEYAFARKYEEDRKRVVEVEKVIL